MLIAQAPGARTAYAAQPRLRRVSISLPLQCPVTNYRDRLHFTVYTGHCRTGAACIGSTEILLTFLNGLLRLDKLGCFDDAQ